MESRSAVLAERWMKSNVHANRRDRYAYKEICDVEGDRKK